MLTTLVEKEEIVSHLYPISFCNSWCIKFKTQTDNVVEAFDLCPSSSYVVFDSSYKYQYDKYNDVFRFVPMNGDTVVFVQTQTMLQMLVLTCGYNRGGVRNAIKLSYNPKKAEE